MLLCWFSWRGGRGVLNQWKMSIRNGGQRVIGTKSRSIQIQVPLTEAILPFWIIVFGLFRMPYLSLHSVVICLLILYLTSSMCIVIIFISLFFILFFIFLESQKAILFFRSITEKSAHLFWHSVIPCLFKCWGKLGMPDELFLLHICFSQWFSH